MRLRRVARAAPQVAVLVLLGAVCLAVVRLSAINVSDLHAVLKEPLQLSDGTCRRWGRGNRSRRR